MGQGDSFDLFGPQPPVSPVVLSVPHAGRAYPAAMAPKLRVPIEALVRLEDRHVDAVARAARREETLLVQRVPRAWIDLNRSERERDPAIDAGADPRALAAPSARLRQGLGLIPRRIDRQEIWRGRLSMADVGDRLTHAYRPYHTALAGALRAARARFGVAVLLDIHSMPPLGPVGEVAQLVFGDRHGTSAAAGLIERMEQIADRAGLLHARNMPYAGGHIIERHAAPARGLHALQIEFDRALYLDAALDAPGAGLAATVSLLRAMIDAVTEVTLAIWPQAAE